MSDDDGRRVVHLRMSRELVRAIDHWRIDRGVTRNEAINVLLKRGIETIKSEVGGAGGKYIDPRH